MQFLKLHSRCLPLTFILVSLFTPLSIISRRHRSSCGVLLGIIMLLTGMGWWCIPTGLIFGLISDFMMKACDYKNAKREVLIHGVFSMWVIGAFIPIVVTRDAYYQNLLPGYGQEYADTLMAYMPDWILPVLLIAAFVSGLVGGLIGRKIFKKHFERAGIV